MSTEQQSSNQSGKLPWGLRVRSLRAEAGITQDALADLIGTTKATISKIERSTVPPKMEWIEKLSAALKVEQAALLFGDATQSAKNQASYIPVIGMIAAGSWREAIQSSEEHIPVVNAKPHMFALKVEGDSINRVAISGSYVAIDPSNPTLNDGSIYAVQNAEGEATLKRFRRNPDRLEPDSTNPEYKPILLGSEAITVIGRATQVISMI